MNTKVYNSCYDSSWFSRPTSPTRPYVTDEDVKVLIVGSAGTGPEGDLFR